MRDGHAARLGVLDAANVTHAQSHAHPGVHGHETLGNGAALQARQSNGHSGKDGIRNASDLVSPQVDPCMRACVGAQRKMHVRPAVVMLAMFVGFLLGVGITSALSAHFVRCYGQRTYAHMHMNTQTPQRVDEHAPPPPASFPRFLFEPFATTAAVGEPVDIVLRCLASAAPAQLRAGHGRDHASARTGGGEQQRGSGEFIAQGSKGRGGGVGTSPVTSSCALSGPVSSLLEDEARLQARYEYFHGILAAARYGSDSLPPAPAHLLGYGSVREREILRQHALEVSAYTARMRGMTPHAQAGYAGPWIENWWIDGIDLACDWAATWAPLVPLFVQWTDPLARAGTGSGVPHTFAGHLAFILRPDVLYVTVVQHKDGLIHVAYKYPRIPSGNILVFSAGGVGHVPIPLLKGVHNATSHQMRSERIAVMGKPLLASFVGSMYSGVRANMSLLMAAMNGTKQVMLRPDFIRVRSIPPPPNATLLTRASSTSKPKVVAAFANSVYVSRLSPSQRDILLAARKAKSEQVAHRSFVASLRRYDLPGSEQLASHELMDRLFEYQGDEWRTVMAASSFQLAPRGTGPTSYRLYEALQMELVPIYVWDDIEWLPYHPRPRWLTEDLAARTPHQVDKAWLSGKQLVPSDVCLVRLAFRLLLEDTLDASALVLQFAQEIRKCCDIDGSWRCVHAHVLRQVVDVLQHMAASTCDRAPGGGELGALSAALFSVHVSELPFLFRLLPRIERRPDLISCMRQRARALRAPALSYQGVLRSVLEFTRIAGQPASAPVNSTAHNSPCEILPLFPAPSFFVPSK